MHRPLAIERVEDGLTVVRVPNLVPVPWRLKASYPWIQAVERWRLRTFLGKLPGEYRPSYRGTVNFDYTRPWLQGMNLSPRSVYICNDDFTLFALSQTAKNLVRRQIRACAKQACRTFITSKEYQDLVGLSGRATVLVPGHSHAVPATPPPLPKAPPIRVGFVGHIDKRLDLDLIQRAASDGELALHFIGKFDGESSRDRLNHMPNVHLHEPLFEADLFEWMLSMHVLWMPYALPKDWAESVTTPNKTLSYFATGRPIVVTGLSQAPEVDGVAADLYRGPEPISSFLKGVVARDTAACAEQRLVIGRRYTADQTFKPIAEALGVKF